MVFLGYEDGTKAYRLYNPARGKVVVSRDVVFDETAAWSWSTPTAGEPEGSGGGLTGEFVVEQLVIERRSGAEEAAQEPEAEAVEPPSPGTAEVPPSPGAASSASPASTPTAAADPEFASPVLLLGVRGCLPRQRGAPIQESGRRHR